MTDALAIAKAKDAIIESRGQSKQTVIGTRKYEIHLADGRCFICIDLLGEPPEDVHRQIREHFWRYDIARID